MQPELATSCQAVAQHEQLQDNIPLLGTNGTLAAAEVAQYHCKQREYKSNTHQSNSAIEP